MKALILAGGLGTRLRPLTYSRPKHLLPIANRPHIDHVFDLLQGHGIEDIVLLTSYLAEAFADAIERATARGMRLEVTHEAEPLGTAGGLKNAQGLLDRDTFIALNGDVLTDFDITKAIAFHRDRGAEGTIVLTPVEDPSIYGVVPTDPDGRVTGFIEKPPRDEAPTNLINAGVYILESSILDRVPANEVWSAERQLFPQLVEEGALFALDLPGYWMDIGTPDKYLAANKDALSGAFKTDATSNATADRVLLDEGAEVAPDARVSFTCLGAGAAIEQGAVVASSVLLPGAIVGRGAHVDGCVLGEGARVSPGINIAGKAFGDREIIEEAV